MFLAKACPVLRTVSPTLDGQQVPSMRPCSFHMHSPPAVREKSLPLKFAYFGFLFNGLILPLIHRRHFRRRSECSSQPRSSPSRCPLQIVVTFFPLFAGHTCKTKRETHTKTFNPANCVCIYTLAFVLLSFPPMDRNCLLSSEEQVRARLSSTKEFYLKA